MASLKGGYKNQGNSTYWKNALNDLRKSTGLKIKLLHDPSITHDMPITETKAYKYHRKIERRSSARKFIKVLGYQCKACGKKLKSEDSGVWESSFEVHHLQPFADLKVEEKRVQTKDDFAVLCSCCHRAIHRTDDVSDIARFKKKYF